MLTRTRAVIAAILWIWLIALLVGCGTLPEGRDLYVKVEIQANNNLTSDRYGEGRMCYDHWCRGDMGVLQVGAQHDVGPALTYDVGIAHTSFLREGDRGLESAYFGLTWRPFKGDK